MSTDYVLAVKRECRATVPPDWQAIVRGIPGVEVMGDASSDRMQVRATPQAVESIRGRLAEYLHIEKVSPRRLSSS